MILIAEKQISDILYGLGFGNKVILDVLGKYEQSNRTYHNSVHISEMLDFGKHSNKVFSANEWDAYRLAVIFHDVIYDTRSKTNEEDSYAFYEECFETLPESTKDFGKWITINAMVKEMILATKEHKFNETLPITTQTIIKADLERLTLPFESFWANTIQLMKEYAWVDWADFKAGRLKFFQDYVNRIVWLGPQAMHNITNAYHALLVWEPKIAVYPGSFNPFHVGHKRILERASKMFDKVIIARGINPDKKNHERLPLPKEITELYQVDEYDGLLTDYLEKKSYPVTVIRGLRSGMDLHGEITQYRYLQDLMPSIQLVNIFTDVDVEHVSSSGIRALKPYLKAKGQDKTDYELE